LVEVPKRLAQQYQRIYLMSGKGGNHDRKTVD
jgi:hypothetical protein